jgi:alkylation response protein AidB-like acyl-CoA dehydrogenase
MAVQVHGGLGFTWEMGLHMYLRHVSALRELSLGLPA